MESERQIPLWLKAGVPLALALLLGLFPYPRQMEQVYTAVRFAEERGDWMAEAQALSTLAGWIPWRMDLWEQAGIKALAAGQPLFAVQSLQTGQTNGKLSPAGQHALAEAQLLRGDKENAVRLWEGIVSSGQARRETYEALLNYYWEQGAVEMALKQGEALLRAEPNHATAQFKVGVLWLVQEPMKATPYLSRAKTIEPKQTKQVDGLLKALDLSRQEQHAGYQKVILGRALGQAGFWRLAEQVLVKATELAPDYAEAWAFLGEARQQLGQEGYSLLQNALALDPRSVSARALTALHFRRTNQPGQALALLDDLAKQEPKQPIWQVELAGLLLDMHDVQAALAYYQAAAQINPADAQYWVLLAQFCAEHQVALREVGLPAARQALTAAPNQPAALDGMGVVMMALDDLTSAERFFTQAIQVDAGYAPAQLHLGQVFLQLGESSQAQERLTLAYQLAVDQPQTRLLAERLLQRFFGGAK